MQYVWSGIIFTMARQGGWVILPHDGEHTCMVVASVQAFIAKCQELKMTGQTSYWLTTEGDLGERKTACVDPNIVRGTL